MLNESTIHLGKGLTLPARAFATNVVAALGMRGSGKSNVMTVAVEGLLAANVQVVVLDYVGIWFGLRLGANGKTPSPFKVPVLGGKHGDIPLVAAAGRQVAEALAASHSSAVLDISAFSKGDRIRFAADFGEAFFHAKKSHVGPVFLLLEEAQRFVPQVIRFADPGLSRCLGAFEEIAEVGRNYGIGLGLISQRPQKINKDVLNLAELVFAFQTNGVLERKAIAEWVQEKGAADRAEVTGELPSLPRGTALVWSPATFKLYGKFAFDKKSTYDAGATPDDVRASVTVKSLDLASLEGAMASVVAEAKTNDPKALRARVSDLERQLGKGAPALATSTKTVTVEKPVIKDADVGRIERLVERLTRSEERLVEHVIAAMKPLGDVRTALARHVEDLAAIIKPAFRPTVVVVPASAPSPALIGRSRYEVRPASDGAPIGKCPRALLSVIVRKGTATARQVSGLSGYSIKSSSFEKGLSTLRSAGLIDGPRDRLVATAAGLAAAGDVDPIPTGRALLDMWAHPRLEPGIQDLSYPGGRSFGMGRNDVLLETRLGVVGPTDVTDFLGARIDQGVAAHDVPPSRPIFSSIAWRIMADSAARPFFSQKARYRFFSARVIETITLITCMSELVFRVAIERHGRGFRT